MKTYIQLFLLFILPIVFLIPEKIPSLLKGATLILVIAITVFISIKEKLSAKELGFRTDNLKQSFVPYGVFTLTAVLVVILLSNLLHKQPLSQWWTYSHLQWGFLPISFVQEFIYRSFAQTKLQKIMKPIWAILVATILYSFIHVLWKDPLILALSFAGGIGFGYLWYKYPNLYLLTISHAILNFLIIYLGFFPWLITSFFNLH